MDANDLIHRHEHLNFNIDPYVVSVKFHRPDKCFFGL